MQFQVPQFIDAEDKIVGPLTLKQFLFIAGAAGISFLFFVFLKMFLFVIFSIPLMGLAIALAFVKINGQPFPTVLYNGFMFYWNPQRYAWQPSNPQLPKTEANMRESFAGIEATMEKVMKGMAIKNAWRYIQTGSKPKEEPVLKKPQEIKESYQVFRKLSGEKSAAKRVDYR